MTIPISIDGGVRRWKRYPAYKDSGVSWLGSLPSHWRSMLFKRVASIRYGLGQPPPSKEDGVPLIRATNIDSGHISTKDLMRVDPLHVPRGKGAFLSAGEIIVVRSGALTGDSAIIPMQYKDAVAGYDMVAQIRSHLPEFFAWQLLSPEVRDFQFGLYKARAAQPHLNAEELQATVVTVPPPDEQRRIADFLVRETTKIDALIAMKVQLIALLVEKRSALISHAVTSGLDPVGEKKESGVPWLGCVPSHWEVIQSRRVFRVRNEPATPSDRQLTASQKHGMLFQSDFVRLEGRRVVETVKGVDSLRHVEPGDFVISLRSFQGGIEWCRLRGSVTFHYVVLKPVKPIHPAYFGYLFKSIAYIQALRATTDFIRDGQDLRYSHFIQVPLPVVPLEEQVAIAAYLDRETARIDSLINITQQTIDKLREYRSALISAAVTGKIDVREEVA